MLQSGHQDEMLLSRIESEAAKLHFTSTKDQKILNRWLSELRLPIITSSSSITTQTEMDATTVGIPSQNFERLRDYQSILSALEEINAHLVSGDEGEARNRLYRLTSTLNTSLKIFVMVILLMFAGGVGYLFWQFPDPPSEGTHDELETIKKQFDVSR